MKLFSIFGVAVFLIAGLTESAAGVDGETEIAKWKDGKKAVFLLAFDDGCASQLNHAIPQLEKRQLVGTFYLVTGNALYGKLKPRWEAAVKSPLVEVANHTFTHGGATTAEQLDEELGKCNEVLWKLHPDRKLPRLLGFGTPGGVPWTVSKEEMEKARTKHHLIQRPPFSGSPIHYKSPEEMIAVVDAALAKGEMGHMDFHGVGGDWLNTPLDWFLPFLDKLVAHREELWITDVVSWHKYVTERNGAQVRVVSADKNQVRLELTATTDSTLYDLPLTLVTKCPADWTKCRVTQGADTSIVSIKEGAARYSATPGEITLEPAW